MNITPCQGHNPVFFKADPGETYTTSKINITRRQFDELTSELQNTDELTLYHFILNPGEKFSKPNFRLRIDNEARTDFSNFFNLQTQINKNGEQLSDTKTTVAQVFVHTDVKEIPTVNLNNFNVPCPSCVHNLIETFKDALNKSFDVTAKKIKTRNHTPEGQSFIVLKKVAESSKRFFSQIDEVAVTPKCKKQNKKS